MWSRIGRDIVKYISSMGISRDINFHHVGEQAPIIGGIFDRQCQIRQELQQMLLIHNLLVYDSSVSFGAAFFYFITDLAFGKRLVSAGRRFQSMGQYGRGELQRIAKAMIMTGKVLTARPAPPATNEEPKQEIRMLKFGELQVELTPEKAYIGAAIGFFFGILSWELSQGIQSIPESSLQYANDNALVLAKSLRGTLLAISYLSTILSAFAAVGLILLGGELKSKEK